MQALSHMRPKGESDSRDECALLSQGWYKGPGAAKGRRVIDSMMRADVL